MQRHVRIACAIAAAMTAPCTMAAVSAVDAARLKSDLTPLGAERAGNQDGTIPPWTGGVPHDPAAAFIKGSKRRADPFADEKPLYSVTAKNLDAHADKLSDGAKALLKRHPETFRIDVYKTHRTGAASPWVYDNTFKNATRGRLEGLAPKDVFGGIPFPIPKSGAEAIWNHLMRVRHTSLRYRAHGWQVTADGRSVMQVDGYGDFQLPYYDPASSVESINESGEWGMARVSTVGPAIHAGEIIAGRDQLDASRSQMWTYLTGQRRVRKLPNGCCDTPSAPSAGVAFYDETQTFSGRIDRFDWKILGKREMIIPYNSNRSLTVPKDSDFLGPHHVKPDHVRWELHRVWVLEATVAAGQRHLTPRSRYYLDEDTWMAVLADRWDAKGQLWKVLVSLPYVAPDLPGVLMGTGLIHDLNGGGYFADNLLAEMPEQFVAVPKFKDSYFTPESLAGEGVR